MDNKESFKTSGFNADAQFTSANESMMGYLKKEIAKAILNNEIWGDEAVDWEALSPEKQKELSDQKADEIILSFNGANILSMAPEEKDRFKHEIGCRIAISCRPLIFDRQIERE